MMARILGLAALCLPAIASAVPAPRYLFYLHGRVVEDFGPYGFSPQFGRYDYPGILKAFRSRGFDVWSERRPSGTDVSAYADKVVAQIRELEAHGVDPHRITVVGASKGAVIGALVSTRLRQPQIHYVLMGNCNDWLIRTYNPKLTGEVLSVYEASDQTGGSCEPVRARSPKIARFAEIRLTTGLGHGFLYRPLPVWIEPTVAWARR